MSADADLEVVVSSDSDGKIVLDVRRLGTGTKRKGSHVRFSMAPTYAEKLAHLLLARAERVRKAESTVVQIPRPTPRE